MPEHLGQVTERLGRNHQALTVRDLLRSLDGKAKAFGGSIAPRFERLGGGHPIKGRVDLDAPEFGCVIREELRFGKIGWVEVLLPFLVAEAGSAEPNVVERHGGYFARFRRNLPPLLFWRRASAWPRIGIATSRSPTARASSRPARHREPDRAWGASDRRAFRRAGGPTTSK